MNSPETNPFETIESAHHFMALLSEAVAEAKQEIESDVQREAAGDEARRMDALRIAMYSLEKLELHVNRSSRLLNDLRTLRRLLFSERTKRRNLREPAEHQEVKPFSASNARGSLREEEDMAVGKDKDGLALEQSA
jgi:hypothetical protein